jgi:hypothetical protein
VGRGNQASLSCKLGCAMWWLIIYLIGAALLFMLKYGFDMKRKNPITRVGADNIRGDAFVWAIFWPILLPFTVLTGIVDLIIRR